MTDYTVEHDGGHGTIYLIRCNNDDAYRWLFDHVDSSAMWFGNRALCVEHRYIGDLVNNLRMEGYTVD